MEKLIIPKTQYYLFDKDGNPLCCAGGIPADCTEMAAGEAEFFKSNPGATGDEVRTLKLNTVPAKELREKRYEVEIPRRLLDAFVSYTAEGKDAEATAVAAEIAVIKARIREEIPDNE